MPTLTKERLYVTRPDFYGLKTIMRHVARYKWALSQLKHKCTVLNAGCGSGYGDYILLNKASYVISVDKSQEAIEFAEQKRKKMRNENIQYITCDLANLSLKEKLDVVVCIEVIEHLNIDDQFKFLYQLKNVLKDDGMLLITTPEKDAWPATEYHQHEFYKHEFDLFLRQFFNDVSYCEPEGYKIPKGFVLAKCRGLYQ